MIAKENNKVIILNGLARGGTNITWNILQSHENIVSPLLETNEIIGTRSDNKAFYGVMNSTHGLPIVSKLARRTVKKVLNHYKLETLKDSENKMKSEFEEYTLEEVTNATLCIKGVCSPASWDLKYTDLIINSFDDAYLINVVRNGFAVCESWLRRGVPPKKAGYYYAKFVDEILSYSQKYKNYKIYKFEDILSSPFFISEELFQFVDEPPFRVDNLRLKVKKTLSEGGKHDASYGQLNKKYWFKKENIGEILKSNINAVQEDFLSEKDRISFENEAIDALKAFNYK